MANKRVAAREWRRKRRQQRMIVRLSIVAACVVALLGAGFIGWDLWSRTYVMTFDGERVPTADLQFFSMFTDGTMDPRVQSLDHLINFMLIDQAARRHNISITADEWVEVEESAVEILNLFEMFGMERPNLSNDRAAEFMSMDILSDRLMDIYVPNFVVDESAFALALDEFLMLNRADFIDMEFIFYHSGIIEVAMEVRAELEASDPSYFEEIVMRDMQLDFDLEDLGLEIEGEGISLAGMMEAPRVSLAELRMDQSFDQWDVDYLSTLSVNQVSELIQLNDGSFLILIPMVVNIMTDDEITELFREHYEVQERDRVFADIVVGWRDEVDIRVNQRGVNAA